MFKLPDLPFSLSALEPHMSAQTLGVHHGKHHAGYVKKLNAALEQRASAPDTLEAVVRLAARDDDDKLFNNAAQAWNHAFFWQCLSPDAQPGPQSELAAAIDAKFKSLDDFRAEFAARGETHFASGWVWLVADGAANLRLVDLHDAHTPMVDADVTPLLVCDVWEHAYYLDHKNERGAYMKAFVGKLINWRFAESQFAAARAGRGGWVYPR